MIELRYLHVDGSDKPFLQYRTWEILTADGIALPLTKDKIQWSGWKMVDGVVISLREYESRWNG